MSDDPVAGSDGSAEKLQLQGTGAGYHLTGE